MGNRHSRGSESTATTGGNAHVDLSTAVNGKLFTAARNGDHLPSNPYVRIVHVSDTHNCHDQITADLFELCSGGGTNREKNAEEEGGTTVRTNNNNKCVDMLIHTGDFTADGSDDEFADFNRWLGDIQKDGRFPLGVFVIMGNHDYKFLDKLGANSSSVIAALADDAQRRAFLQKKLPNAIVLDSELRCVKVPINRTNRNESREDGQTDEGADAPTGTATLNLYACPWYPFNGRPTYPDHVSSESAEPQNDHDKVFQAWAATVPAERKNEWSSRRGESEVCEDDEAAEEGEERTRTAPPPTRKKKGDEAWRYDEIASTGSAVDIVLTHGPPQGVFDLMPLFPHWGSSPHFLSCVARMQRPPRALLFGHVHAQRGYWEKLDFFGEATAGGVTSVTSGTLASATKTRVVGGVQYATETHEQTAAALLLNTNNGATTSGSSGGAVVPEAEGIQLISNMAMMSDRTVQPLAKKRIVGKPRLITGVWITSAVANGSGSGNDSRGGAWHFHAVGGDPKPK